MAAIIKFTCDHCFNEVHNGYTSCYTLNSGKVCEYHLSSIEHGLKEKKEEFKAGVRISHICSGCAKDIHDEFKRNQKAKK